MKAASPFSLAHAGALIALTGLLHKIIMVLKRSGYGIRE
jgi:hypothetical protein